MGAGAPRKKIDLDLMDNLAKIHCTMEEMASILGVSKDTLERRYLDRIHEMRDQGKMSLRRKLFTMALEKENLGAMIWLSKQHLGMSDKIEEKLDQTVKHEQISVFKTSWANEITDGEVVQPKALPAAPSTIKVS